MRMLFEIDKKNYEKGGKTARRPSVRGIMIKDGKVAMMHSVRYDYYKLPGGGIEDEESLEDTLVREVREESGLIVDKDTIKEYGYVHRIEKGHIDDIFIQDNYYFLCDVFDEQTNQNLDDYEEFEMFKLEYVTSDYAISINNNSNHKEKEELRTFRGMLDRENRVLQLIKEELL